MIIEMSQPVIGPDGIPFEKSETDKTPVPLKHFLREALLNAKSSIEANAMEKVNRAVLARRINESGMTQELSIDDLKLCKDCVGEAYGPWIVMQVWEILEAKGK